MKMENRPIYAYIPKNLNFTGGLFGGLVDARRLTEGLIGAGFAFLLYEFLSNTLKIKDDSLLYICAILGLVLFIAGLVGGNGEPLSVFIFNFINYENRRIYVTLRPPMPTFDKSPVKEKMGDTERISFQDKLALLKKGKSKKKGGES